MSSHKIQRPWLKQIISWLLKHFHITSGSTLLVSEHYNFMFSFLLCIVYSSVTDCLWHISLFLLISCQSSESLSWFHQFPCSPFTVGLFWMNGSIDVVFAFSWPVLWLLHLMCVLYYTSSSPDKWYYHPSYWTVVACLWAPSSLQAIGFICISTVNVTYLTLSCEVINLMTLSIT